MARHSSHTPEQLATEQQAQNISEVSVSESKSTEKSESDKVALSVVESQWIFTITRIAVEVARQRLEVLDQTAPLRILQSLSRCNQFVRSVERIFDEPLSLENMFYANLAISASTPFEAWDTSHNGKVTAILFTVDVKTKSMDIHRHPTSICRLFHHGKHKQAPRHLEIEPQPV
jgi:hypothetical protein